MGRRNRDNDGKYVRLTGLWPSKKNDTLWSGKIRNQDIGAVIDKLDEADKENADVVVFLWENKERNGKKDPEFTVQIAVSEGDDNNRGRGRGSRNYNDDRDDNNDDSGADNDDNDSDERDSRSSRKSSKSDKKDSKGSSRSRRSSSGSSSSSSSKRDKNDW